MVLFVDRGICTFAAKVEVAQSCGADAVVVVDQGAQGWTREMIRHNIIMSDDGKVSDMSALLGCMHAYVHTCGFTFPPRSRSFLSFPLNTAGVSCS